MSEIVYLLTLLNTPKIGRKKVWKAIPMLRRHKLSGIHELRDMLLDSGFNNHEIPGSDALSASYSHAVDMLEKTDQMGIAVLWADSAHYPERLINTNDPPVLLYVKGNPSCLISDSTCAAIGTRQPSSYGIKCARRLGAFLASKGFVVVSGLARGCDTAAHQGCVQEKGRTIAVLAHGLDKIYPAENRELADRIVSTGGCLVSEHPPGGRTFKHGFVERNRIQSGLSSGLIVIEAGIKGGIMHTVQFGLEQGRPIACIQHPQQMTSFSQAQGNKRLIAEGKAVPLKSQEDVDTFLLKISGSDTKNDHKDNGPAPAVKKYLQSTFWGL